METKMAGRRDTLKIAKLLRQKNLSEEYNFIYDNINDVNKSAINNTKLKDAYKKVLMFYKEYKEETSNPNNNSYVPSIEEMEEIDKKISYGTKKEMNGDMYKVLSDDSFCGNVLIPYDTYIYNFDDKWLYKHIEIPKPPQYIDLIKSDILYSDYKKYVDGEISIDNRTNAIDVAIQGKNSIMAQYGVRFK